MPNRARKIYSVKSLTIKLEMALYAQSAGVQFTLKRASEVLEAIAVVGQKKIKELKDLVSAFLEHRNPEYRAMALWTLGAPVCLGLPEFKKRAFEIWQQDTAETVRAQALSVWSLWYEGTKKVSVLSTLFNILKDDNNTPMIHYQAWRGLYCVATQDSLFQVEILNNQMTKEQLNSLVDWEEAENIIKNVTRQLPVIQ